ncbi:MAG TPA: MerR family transcriptional regulator [Leptospiraceae bacterium]|uniref:MerR HTH family regulatory protein n=1 Tax=Leptospira ellinghausenii TaxID=1917822 RepID=A0A2P2DIZ6_9LEPT|nr:MerR family transcriptional regulator [Leptospira ellinghausenii]HMW08614.1 MerR family transcriptional regulator [Leptospiraceae bacterium]GBF44633.1 MerR HTH family regulatory protein [Leptospira ellinghausenii]HNC59554.1 MerR family transcriptional regulator [Leptospiraceae bacterium]HNE11412.1 MerR family transcriptional regulator [Leptospiraceae bacterium]HNF57770.1 MerR family transcriptional regulator [Leptospiraceae bacterium]
MLIGEFSRKSKLTREAIRFYEKEGLLVGTRKDNNYREYSEKDIRVVQFIASLKELGFTLPEIKNILDLYNSEQKCKDVQRKLEKNLENIENKLTTLKNVKENLLKSIKECEENPDKKSCNIIAKILL